MNTSSINVDITLVISIISVAFALYYGFSSLKRSRTCDDRNDASQLTTVIVKLENIGLGISDIKNKLNSIEIDVRETRERLVIVEESTKSAHKRMDSCEKFCKKFFGNQET